MTAPDRRARLLAGAALAALAALCAGPAESVGSTPPVDTGMVLAVDAGRGTVTISVDARPGLDEGVATFAVAPPGPPADLARGALVEFTLDGQAPRRIQTLRVRRYAPDDAQGLKVAQLRLLESIGSAAPDIGALRIGDAVPDFTLLDSERREVRLSALRGRLVAVSFMYTSCHLPDYCFRLTNNFALVQRRFAAGLDRDVVLLTITFDPIHDQPDVLARYAAEWKARRGWRVLGGPPEDVRRVCHLFGMRAFPEMGMMAHDLRTAIIDRDGRLVANIEGNAFTGRQLGDLIQVLLD